MLDRANILYLVDANQESVKYCQDRFEKSKNVKTICNQGKNIDLPSNSITFIYSWDAMVHFNYKMLDYYFSEFDRLLKKDGFALIHHSNLADCDYFGKISEQWSDNPGSRSNVSKDDIARISGHYHFKVIQQSVFDWGIPNIDCITVLQKI